MNAREIFEKYELTDRDVNRIVEMAWEDRTPFDAIKAQFGLSEAEVIKLMKDQMQLRNWQKWRARVQGRATKHRQLRETEVNRFKSTRQRDVSNNRISKRKS
ncbi:MAG: TIGR03643 family protein [Phaeodactylibacter sp.]|nr:TIGR03643 family protein [Phaeodactylibacter sp.]MCB0570693.1 TIGR03643 family protein [Phaeodactylibacter sp.]MCB9302045.1 TIGR03643 family protein [Lewinellaceae bacterium]HQU63821.1 TIGR03643 family protein [Nitrosomonas sp.]